MYRRFHDRFGTAGVVIGVIALIAALGGTALAAGGLTKAQEKQVTKIAKKYAGKPGAAGVAGTNGTNGTNGKDAAPGAAGSPGSDGEGVTVAAASAAECPEGGTKFSNGTGTGKACNGAEGEEGPPGTGGGGTLPEDATETGTYLIGDTSPVYGGLVSTTAISFPIPLDDGLDSSHIIYLAPGESDGNCNDGFSTNGTPSSANPEAASGYLCIFSGDEAGGGINEGGPGAIAAANLTTLVIGSTSTTGAILAGNASTFEPVAAGELYVGTWAVTG